MNDLHFVLGGMRSGKSRHAQQLAREGEREGFRVTVLVTALAGDAEMHERIARHRAERPSHWVTVELQATTLGLADAVRAHAAEGTLLLLDCLTVWLSQLIAPPAGEPVQDDARAVDALLAAIDAAPGRMVVVSNEIGLGVVPLDAVTRRVVDALGRLHQRLAERARYVSWMVAGLAMPAKGRAP